MFQATKPNNFSPQVRPKNSRLQLFGICLLVCLGVALGLYIGKFNQANKILLSPLSESSAFSFLPSTETRTKTTKIVYGFLPYWNLTKVTIHPELTHLGYFGLTIGSDGSLLVKTAEGTEPGYAKLQSDEFLTLARQLKTSDIQLELVVIQFNNDDIVSFLASEKAHQRFLDSIDSALLAYPFTGINIDIEYSGEVTESVRKNLVTLTQKLDTHLQKKPGNIPLSIDVYASGASPNSFWNVSELNQYVDYFIIMAYDFHRRSSPVAGPVAPIFGGKTLWDHDISNHLQQFAKLVPTKKLLLGVPFYGYEWQTTTTDPQAFTLPKTGATASYERVQKILSQSEVLDVTQGWSEEALSPYLIYKENDENYVLYYENSRSMSYKFDFVNQLDLGGIAIWALGYDGPYRELWDVIDRKLR